jgi:hypothetical protein
VARGSALTLVPQVASRAGPGEATCATHANNAAVSTCERCGDFMCILCASRVEGRLYCPRCLDLLYTRGALKVEQQRFTEPAAALRFAIYSLLGFFVCGISHVVAIAAIVKAASALRQIRLRPGLSGRNEATAALIIGSISLLVSTAFTTWLLLQSWS